MRKKLLIMHSLFAQEKQPTPMQFVEAMPSIQEEPPTLTCNHCKFDAMIMFKAKPAPEVIKFYADELHREYCLNQTQN